MSSHRDPSQRPENRSVRRSLMLAASLVAMSAASVTSAWAEAPFNFDQTCRMHTA
jgi:hypothetical protein